LYKRLVRTVAAACLALMALVALIPFANGMDVADLIVPMALAGLAWWLWHGAARRQ